jgi:hypothetical protein
MFVVFCRTTIANDAMTRDIKQHPLCKTTHAKRMKQVILVKLQITA